MEVTCPLCEFVAENENEEDVKHQLMQHCVITHRMKGCDFENMYGELKILATLFLSKNARGI
jgi:hypothetical protein